jgi:hypothetical protein
MELVGRYLSLEMGGESSGGVSVNRRHLVPCV